MDIGQLLRLAVVVLSRMETATDTATGGSGQWITTHGREAANRGRFVVEDLENRVQLGDL